MIVIGTDPHMKTHTVVALEAATGARASERSVTSEAEGYDELLVWARGLGDERVFAIGDCHHISGRLERYLLPGGERVVRVPPEMTAGSARSYDMSDPIDAARVARAALREPDLRHAARAGASHSIRRRGASH